VTIKDRQVCVEERFMQKMRKRDGTAALIVDVGMIRRDKKFKIKI
jgi:hypothetical protein